jgi:anti-sigma regulatory factor (Ser/Thr protein kinase)
MSQSPRSSCMLMAAFPHAAGRARSYARWVLGGWRLHGLADTAELLVSELVTNAISATGVAGESTGHHRSVGKVNPIYLCLSVLAETLLIEVCDVSSEPPLRRTASDEDESGRGLFLVQTLSKEWGYELLETGGKVVWCKVLIGEAT